MTDRDAMLRAVLEHPADDAPRLVYADWLDDHGQGERAEFIRVQVGLADPTLGPPHIVVSERCVIEYQHGPDYFSLTGGEGLANGGRLILEAKPGDRVDVLKPRGRKGPLYGLRVHKITDDEIILVNDARAKPWAGESLRRRERELWKLPEAGKWFGDDCYITIGRSLFERAGDGRKPFALIRRGFVASVRLPTAVFVGAVCGRCQGRGYTRSGRGPDTDIQSTCSACKGANRTEGVAAALFRSHPITAVTLTDRRPTDLNIARRAGVDWLWQHYAGDGNEENWRWRLPRAIVEAMQDDPRAKDYRLSFAGPQPCLNAYFDSEAAALDALSRAAVAYGRNLAGLPPLPAAQVPHHPRAR